MSNEKLVGQTKLGQYLDDNEDVRNTNNLSTGYLLPIRETEDEHKTNQHVYEKIRKLGIVEASAHTPIYQMHKFWARRPWKVFRKLIQTFTNPGDIILDPFAGGGVVLIEGLVSKRRVIAVDLNPLAIMIMQHEVHQLDIDNFSYAIKELARIIEPIERRLFGIECKCGTTAIIEWIEHGEGPLLASYFCPYCGSKGRERLSRELPEIPMEKLLRLGLKRIEIPVGDKTSDLLKRGIKYFDELFTSRNLYLIFYIKKAIEELEAPDETKSFLRFALSSSLKWASKMSHRRGEVIEGWAMHAYWIYPTYLEINVWRQFLRRARAIIRGKRWSNLYVGACVGEVSPERFCRGEGDYLILQADSRNLPLPDSCVDHVITDPPYGDNVNYAELSDYFLWIDGNLAPKNEEIVINKTRGFTLDDYKIGLERVFRECYRVLKSNGLFISTFNSKDLRVVGAFLSALSSAGFSFIGISYQPYLKAYTTTFHAMQIDALPFDFVFFFQKPETRVANSQVLNFNDIQQLLTSELEISKNNSESEREYRMRTYPKIVPLLVSPDWDRVKLLTSFYEKLIQKENEYFVSVRKKRTERRVKNVKTL